MILRVQEPLRAHQLHKPLKTREHHSASTVWGKRRTGGVVVYNAPSHNHEVLPWTVK